MLTSSAKGKGRKLQQFVRDKILEYFPELKPDDVISTSMGNQGEDVTLSPRARELLPISIECKNRKAFAIYKDYLQSEHNCKGFEPVLVIKQNRSEPLAVIDLEYLLDLIKLSIDKR